MASTLAKRDFHIDSSRRVHYDPTLDSVRRYLTDTPTASRFAATLKAIDQGDVAAMVELNEEMEAKDSHLQAVAEKRRQAITALDWAIERSPRADENDGLADEAAEFVADSLDAIERWPGTLKHLSTAIGPGVAATELVWERFQLVDTVDIPGHRLISQPWFSPDILLETFDNMLGDEMPRGKFIIYCPQARAGFPMRVTITRAQAVLWLMKKFAQGDWAGFTEVFGMPVRVGTYTDNVTGADRAAVKSMLENMGSDRWAMFPEGVTIEMLEAGRGSQPYEGMIDYLEKKQTILYLGQTLTTDMGAVGSFAAARVHENVGASIQQDDVNNEAAAIRNQVIKPIVLNRWPGRVVPIPIFKRKLIETKNLDADRLALERLRMAKDLGLEIDASEQYKVLGFSRPEQTSGPVDTEQLSTINELTLGIERAARTGDLALTNALRTRIADILATTIPPLVSLPTQESPGGLPQPKQ